MVVWWPNMHKQIEALSLASCCHVTCKTSYLQWHLYIPSHFQTVPTWIMQALLIIIIMLLVVVDAFSKWIKVLPVKSASQSRT